MKLNSSTRKKHYIQSHLKKHLKNPNGCRYLKYHSLLKSIDQTQTYHRKTRQRNRKYRNEDDFLQCWIKFVWFKPAHRWICVSIRFVSAERENSQASRGIKRLKKSIRVARKIKCRVNAFPAGKSFLGTGGVFFLS